MVIRFFAVVLLLFAIASPAQAIPIANPAPAIAGDDDGSSVFLPDDVVVSIEILDLGPLLIGDPFPAGGFGGTEFGFYYYDDPSNRITIFDDTDQNPDPGGAGDDPQLALINFLTGEVLDSDEGTVQSAFTAFADTPIGFYITLSDDLVDFFSFSFNTIYTQASLNPDGEDMAAAFPLLSNPGYLFAFGATSPFGAGNTLLLNLQVAVNVSATTVPAPPALILLLGGLLQLFIVRRRRLRQVG